MVKCRTVLSHLSACFFFVFLALLHQACVMWDLSSLTRDQTCAPCGVSVGS